MATLRTRVGIVGAGPAGLFLSHLLAIEGVDSIVLEQRDRAYVEQRVRAGVLEHGTADLLEQSGVGQRMRTEGLVHHGIELRFNRTRHRLPLSELADGRFITVYGQQEVVKDLIAARLSAGGALYFNANVVGLEDVATRRPSIRYVDATGEHAVHCDIVAGCDGFHGISRTSLGPRTFSAFEHEHPFAWLGILAAAPPSTRELIYCRHPRGFALYSMRSPQLSRLYLQVSPSDSLAAWHDERIWEELGTRLDTDDDWALSTGPVIEKSITPMRSFVLQPVQFGSLFLAGDAAHIVPPTGAKGMNLAIADVHDLAKGIVGHFRRNDDSGLTRYSDTCTRRAWRAQDFSMSMTTMLHPSGPDGFDAQLQLSRLGSVVDSPAAARRLAECYVDLCSS